MNAKSIQFYYSTSVNLAINDVTTETKQTIISGLGEQHIDVLISKLSSKYAVNVVLEEPIVPYRETIRGKVKVEIVYSSAGALANLKRVKLTVKAAPGVEYSKNFAVILQGIFPHKAGAFHFVFYKLALCGIVIRNAEIVAVKMQPGIGIRAKLLLNFNTSHPDIAIVFFA